MSDKQHGSGEPAGAKLKIAPPSPERAPLRVNVFEFMCTVNTALGPLFPYVDEGSIVVGVGVFSGAPHRRFGIFQHFNTVDEIYTIFGSHGTPMPVGLVSVGAAEHYVNPGFANPEDPASHVLFVIVQRQAEPGIAQHERLSMLCENCQTPLLTTAFPVNLTDAVRARISEGSCPPFETILRSAEIAEQFNTDADKRVCAECGHVNPPFPLESWGWSRYVEQCRTIGSAFAAYRVAAGAPGGEAGPA